jgi:hypothetical protein
VLDEAAFVEALGAAAGADAGALDVDSDALLSLLPESALVSAAFALAESAAASIDALLSPPLSPLLLCA